MPSILSDQTKSSPSHVRGSEEKRVSKKCLHYSVDGKFHSRKFVLGRQVFIILPIQHTPFGWETSSHPEEWYMLLTLWWRHNLGHIKSFTYVCIFVSINKWCSYWCTLINDVLCVVDDSRVQNFKPLIAQGIPQLRCWTGAGGRAQRIKRLLTNLRTWIWIQALI